MDRIQLNILDLQLDSQVNAGWKNAWIKVIYRTLLHQLAGTANTDYRPDQTLLHQLAGTANTDYRPDQTKFLNFKTLKLIPINEFGKKWTILRRNPCPPFISSPTGLFEYIFWIRNAGCRARLRGFESKIYLYRMRWYAMQ